VFSADPERLGELKSHEYVCLFQDEENDDLDLLTPGEEMQIARIIANAQRREKQRQEALATEAEKEQAAENARRAKCSIPLLWVNCPARK